MSRNLKVRVVVLFAIVFSAVFCQRVRATGYVAIDLTVPAGVVLAAVNGIGDGQIVGFGYEEGAASYVPVGLLWSGPAHDVTQFGDDALIWGVGGGQQVGGMNGWTSAIMWQGTKESGTVLCDGTSSMALNTDGVHQVGCGGAALKNAALWSGTVDSLVNLSPVGCLESVAYGVSGDYQVGYGYFPGVGTHALLWNGSAVNYVDLNPGKFSQSCARAISGSQEVGDGTISSTGADHALLWSGTAASARDLNPSGFTSSFASGTNGAHQVGYGAGSATGGVPHALVWNGTAQNYVDLNQFLPSGFLQSGAAAIDDQGNIVGSATDSTGNAHAILWVPVPEPAGIVMMGMWALLLGLFWRRRR